MGIAYLQAALKQHGHEVTIVDRNNETWTLGGLGKSLGIQGRSGRLFRQDSDDQVLARPSVNGIVGVLVADGRGTDQVCKPPEVFA